MTVRVACGFFMNGVQRVLASDRAGGHMFEVTVRAEEVAVSGLSFNGRRASLPTFGKKALED